MPGKLTKYISPPKPGKMGSPSTPGTPAVPGHAEEITIYEQEATWFVTPASTYQTWAHPWGGPPAPKPPMVTVSAPQTVTFMGYIMVPKTVTVWVGGQPAIGGSPGTASTPDDYSHTLNLGWNAGAVSIGSHAGDFSYRVTVSPAAVGIVTGANYTEQGYGYAEIDYGFYFSKGRAVVMEGGAQIGGLDTFSGTDVFEVTRVGTQVVYRKNGIDLYASTAPSTGVMFADISMYAGGDTLLSAAFGVFATVEMGAQSAVRGAGMMRLSDRMAAFAKGAGVAYGGLRVNGVTDLIGTAVARCAVSATMTHVGALYGAAAGVSGGVTSLGRASKVAAVLSGLIGSAGNKTYCESGTFLPPLQGAATIGMLAPTVTAIVIPLPTLMGTSRLLPGGVGSSGAVMPALRGTSSDREYAYADNVLPNLRSVSITPFVAPVIVEITAPPATLYALGHDSTGENSFTYRAPKPSLSAFGGSSAKLAAPSPSLSITATVVNFGSAALQPPSATLAATGTVSGTGYANLTFGFSNGDSYDLIGYGGGLASITLTGRPTVQATGSSGAVGGARITARLFELTASGTAQNYGSALLLAPSAALGATAQAWLVAPSATLTAIGTAVVTATYEAYAVNLNHKRGVEPVDETTHYTNFPFTHVVRYQNSYFGANSTGLYLLEGTTDEGADISYAVKTTSSDLDSANLKTVASAFFKGRLGPEATVTLYAGEGAGVPYTYTTPRGALAQNHREVFGRGIKQHRYYSLGVAGSGVMELDGVELDVKQMNRRI